MRTIVLQLPIFLLFTTCGADNSPRGKLTEKENFALSEQCGQYLPSDLEFVAISPRHIIVDVQMEFLRDKFDMQNCKNNMFKIQNGKGDDEANVTYNFTNTHAWYIGICDTETPRGFIIVEHFSDYFYQGSPLCLPSIELEVGDDVRLLGSHSISNTVVDFCKNEITSDFCAKNYDRNFVGPLVDPQNARETYVGHAYNDKNETTRILSIYQYKEQICEVTGICDLQKLGTDNQNYNNLETAKSYFQAIETDAAFSTSDEHFWSNNPLSYSEIIVIASDENDEDTGSGFVADSSIDYEFSDYVDDSVPSFMPIASMDNEHISSAEIISAEATVVRAEPMPLSAVIIPLPDTTSPAGSPTQFSSSSELLIAGLILVALFFFVCMCINGCVERDENANVCRVDSEDTPV